MQRYLARGDADNLVYHSAAAALLLNRASRKVCKKHSYYFSFAESFSKDRGQRSAFYKFAFAILDIKDYFIGSINMLIGDCYVIAYLRLYRRRGLGAAVPIINRPLAMFGAGFCGAACALYNPGQRNMRNCRMRALNQLGRSTTKRARVDIHYFCLKKVCHRLGNHRHRRQVRWRADALALPGAPGPWVRPASACHPR